MQDALGFELRLSEPFAVALERVVAELKREGFGVLTRVDVHEAFREKLGLDFRPYVILGACNPPLAHRALSARPEAGLLLPCNVTVEADGAAAVVVRIVNPAEMMKAGGFEDDPALAEVGAEADARLRRVADALRARK
jgi:uncharacterized protein (DUF302 family)